MKEINKKDMNIAIVIVSVVGILCIVISFFMIDNSQKEETDSDKSDFENQNHITDKYELNEEEVSILQQKVSDKISTDVNDIITNADQELSTMTNEKMMALGDYAVTVCDEIEKNHKEVMFLYGMLGDKEKELKELVSSVESKANELRKANDIAMENYVSTPVMEPEFEEMEENLDSLDDMVEEKIEEPTNTNEIILEMKRNGMSILEIARQLGLGVGEVKLVVDLYQRQSNV